VKSCRARLFLPLLLALSLGGCTFGVPMSGPGGGGNPADYGDVDRGILSKTGNPSSYVVFGKRYQVLDSAAGFTQRGMASWYGPDFHGKRTSSGETYDMHAMTAAHKTLPIPSRVRVTNLANGKSVIVKVNDRGPFARGRIIDLSYAAARKLDMIGPGTAEVKIEVVDRNGRRKKVRAVPLKEDGDNGSIYIQLGSFASEANARRLMKELLARREQPLQMKRVEADQGVFFRVQLGPLADVAEADSVRKRLQRKGYRQARIVIED